MTLKINTVIIGNIAFDINSFYYGKETEQLRTTNNGGACFYSAIPASLFYPVGIVGRVGSDFNVEVFKKYDIDILGLKILDGEKSTCFHQIYKDIDPKKREVIDYINDKMLINVLDIPPGYLKCKHIHLATNEPRIQLELIKYLRENSNAIISVDTIKGFAEDPITRQVFDMADIAFIDYDFAKLLACKANTKIIKHGKFGCYYKSNNKTFFVQVDEKPVVDKTGAGDCMNGVFINLISNGCTPEKALEVATKVATESIQDYGIEHIKVRNIHL